MFNGKKIIHNGNSLQSEESKQFIVPITQIESQVPKTQAFLTVLQSCATLPTKCDLKENMATFVICL